MKQFKIGVDIGNVLANRYGPDGTVIYGVDNFWEAPYVEDAEDALKQLVADYGAENIYIISRASTPELEKAIRRWLEERRLVERCGVLPEHIHFCRERAQKAKIGRKIGLNAMIDDRIEVLLAFDRNVHLLGFRCSEEEARRFRSDQHMRIIYISGWHKVPVMLQTFRLM